MKEYNYDTKIAKENILNNKHNHITSAYYLLLKKYIRMGNQSIGDLESHMFRDYINNSGHLLSKKQLSCE